MVTEGIRFYMNFYDLRVEAADGSIVSMSDFKGKVVLVVNTATGCGFTPQYKSLEEMYEKYNEKGFESFGSGIKALGMAAMLKIIDKNYKNNPDIKWNFTKFVIDREGKVVARFEPTIDMKKVEEFVASLI